MNFQKVQFFYQLAYRRCNKVMSVTKCNFAKILTYQTLLMAQKRVQKRNTKTIEQNLIKSGDVLAAKRKPILSLPLQIMYPLFWSSELFKTNFIDNGRKLFAYDTPGVADESPLEEQESEEDMEYEEAYEEHDEQAEDEDEMEFDPDDDGTEPDP